MTTPTAGLSAERRVFWAIRNTHEGNDSYYAATDSGWTWVNKAEDGDQFPTRCDAEEVRSLLASRFVSHVYTLVRVTTYATTPPPTADATPADVEDVASVVAGLRELRDMFDEWLRIDPPHGGQEASRSGKTRDVLSRAITALESRGEVGRWVPWKPGDALPVGKYYVAWRYENGDIESTDSIDSSKFFECDVIAYWSIPLPPPYDAALLEKLASSSVEVGEGGGK